MNGKVNTIGNNAIGYEYPKAFDNNYYIRFMLSESNISDNLDKRVSQDDFSFNVFIC
jgi:hypothetical protein